MVLAACSSSPLARTAPDDGGPTADSDPPALVFAEHVVAGADEYRCSYLAPATTDTFLVGVSHVATTGAHHVFVFRTDLASIPAGGGGPVDCHTDASTPMQHMRGEVYGSQARTGAFAFPSGVGLPLRAGEVLLVEIHWANAQGQDVDATVDLRLSLSATGVTTAAGTYFFDDPFVDVPAGASGAASMRCPIPSDITLLSESSHDHARATEVGAFLDPPDAAPATAPFYTGLTAYSPLPVQDRVPVGAGSHIRFGCSYQNVAGAEEVLQGFDFQADEMCLLTGTYYPALDSSFESCARSPDEFGTGNVPCAATLACVSACPPGTAPPADLGLPSVPRIDPCWQRCVVASCTDASARLFELEACARSNCAADCAAPSSAACGACQAAQCPAEARACASDACGG
jgi:hypothetical protein